MSAVTDEMIQKVCDVFGYDVEILSQKDRASLEAALQHLSFRAPLDRPNLKQDLIQDGVNVYLTWASNEHVHGGNIDLLMKRIFEIWEPELRNLPSCTGGRDAWLPIESAPKGRKIVAGYFNELGNWRSVMACYYLPKTLDWNSDHDGGDEDGFAPEGWYEEIENTETIFPMGVPTHWQPLPAPPTSKDGSP